MDYTILNPELQNDPESMGYAGKTATEQSQIINASTRSCYVPIEISRVHAHLIKQPAVTGPGSEWTAIKTASNDNTHAAFTSADGLTDWVAAPHSHPFDLGEPGALPMLASLRDGGLISAASYDAIVAMGSGTCSRATELGLPVVMPGNIETSIQQRAAAGQR